MADGEVIYEIRGDASNLDKDLAEGESKVSKSVGKLGDIAKGGAIAIGAAFVGSGVAAVNLANDMDKAVNGIIAATGEGTKSAEKYQGAIESIYKNNYGEGFEDIANNIALVKQQMGDLDDSEMQRIVEKGYLLSDTFGIEMSESFRAVDAMISQFGISSEQAYELMTQGAQNGLNQNGDLADQLAEYSVYYSDLGYSAEEMFNAVVNGSKDGAYQIDYLNDAVKEFGIRSKDGSTASADAFEALGLNSKEMTEAFANGGDGAKQAFDLVTNSLKNCDDKIKQNSIGVALFGTKWEDLGVDAVMALTNTEGEIDKTKNKLSKMENVKYDSVGEMFEEMKRSVELLLIPLGEKLIPILGDVIKAITPIVEDVLPPILGFIGQLLTPLTELIKTILPSAVENIKLLIENATPLIEKILSVIVEVLNQLLPPLTNIIKAILPPLIEILDAILDPLLELIKAILPPLVDLLNSIAPVIEALMPVVKVLVDILVGEFEKAIDLIMPLIKNLMGYFKGLIDFITGVFTGDWEKAWDGIVNAFKNIFNIIPTIVEGVLNGAISLINGIVGGINNITGVVGIPAIPTIPTINLPRLEVGVDYVPDDNISTPLHKGVLTANEADIYSQIGSKGSLADFKNDKLLGGDKYVNVTLNTTNNSPKALSAKEVYMNEKKLAQRMVEMI